MFGPHAMVHTPTKKASDRPERKPRQCTNKSEHPISHTMSLELASLLKVRKSAAVRQGIDGGGQAASRPDWTVLDSNLPE
jgi:hypothetical protein